MTAIAVPARGRRHPMTVVTRARELARVGLTAREIVDELALDDVTVGITSVKRWTDPKVARRAQRHNISRAARKARSAGARPMGHQHALPEYKLARMFALRERGMTDVMIAVVMSFDFGDRLHECQVRRALREQRYPKRDSTREHTPTNSTPCGVCGRAIPYSGRGRPVTRCGSCAPD